MVRHANAAEGLSVVLPLSWLAKGAKVQAAVSLRALTVRMTQAGPVPSQVFVRVLGPKLVGRKQEGLTRRSLLVPPRTWRLLLLRLSLHDVPEVLHIPLHVLHSCIRDQRNIRRRRRARQQFILVLARLVREIIC